MGYGTLISSGNYYGAVSTVPVFTENGKLLIHAGETESTSNLIDTNDFTSAYHYVKIEVKPEAESCTISFDANEGTGSMTSTTISAGSPYTLPECTFTAPEGKVFKAWLIGSAEYAAGTSYTPTGDVTAYAVWVDSTLVAPSLSVLPIRQMEGFLLLLM